MSHTRLFTQATSLSLSLASLALGGCSDGSALSQTRSGLASRYGGTAEALATAGAVTPSSPVEAAHVGRDDSYAIALSHAPWAQCTIRPEHADDTVRIGRVPAGADGELRFYAPPADWGRRLEVDCTDGGRPTQQIVDLDDPSTFTRKSVAELQARRVGVRPPLTGDLATMPITEILRRGYPPRPDPVSSPTRYTEWVRDVRATLDAYTGVPVAHLGTRAGTFSGAAFPATWDGFVQAGGFTGDGAANQDIAYTAYAAVINVPLGAQCGGRTSCESMIWAGIGGYKTSFYTQDYTGSLIQSGIHVNGHYTSPIIYLFIEYHPNDPVDVQAPPFYSWDQIRVWGWASGDSGCQTQSTTGQWACFSFIDYTRNWSFTPPPQPRPTAKNFVPSTVEFVAERPYPGTSYNANYGYTIISDAWGFDVNGNARPGPATGSDHYVWITSSTQGALNGLSLAEFANGSYDTPADPMYFVWNKYNF